MWNLAALGLFQMRVTLDSFQKMLLFTHRDFHGDNLYIFDSSWIQVCPFEKIWQKKQQCRYLLSFFSRNQPPRQHCNCLTEEVAVSWTTSPDLISTRRSSYNLPTRQAVLAALCRISWHVYGMEKIEFLSLQKFCIQLIYQHKIFRSNFQIQAKSNKPTHHNLLCILFKNSW